MTDAELDNLAERVGHIERDTARMHQRLGVMIELITEMNALLLSIRDTVRDKIEVPTFLRKN
jgi:Mg2+ and Co2+ transporter CorA